MPPKKTSRRTAKAPIIDTSCDNLVIVESPAKAKTIKKYLGPWFEVTASMWHIADLPKSNDAIDKANNFTPTYEVSSDKKKVVSALKKAAKEMKKVRLATDEDREGEAIAWHICRACNLDVETTPRIVFHEITKNAITKAVENPRTLDMDLVNAQQARRVLDRLVWFELSPVLWKKVKPSLSAWRVQSVAVRLLVEREREILNHDRELSFKTEWIFSKDKVEFKAKLKETLKKKEDVESCFALCAAESFTVWGVEKKPGKRNPSAPYTTSTLQQDASRRLGYSVSKTMQLAQRLYEAGHITYMRTDSVSLSKQALAAAKKEIEWRFGVDYSQVRNFATKSKWAQEAHEAIRPTKLEVDYAGWDEQQKKLYHLIWQRTLASQMAPAKIEKTIIDILVQQWTYNFQATWEVVVFDWFLAAYPYWSNAKEESLLPPVKEGDGLDVVQITAEETYSKWPARFGEASLVRKLEELWIGRPSTYAPTISTIQQRWYVEKRDREGDLKMISIATLKGQKTEREQSEKYIWWYKNKLVPTSIWMVVTDFLMEHFPKVMEYEFTAKVEEEFDHIADGKLKRQEMIKSFYDPFHERVIEVDEHADRASGERVLGNDPATGKVVKVRIGRYGPLVQIGEQDDEDKQFAPIRGQYTIETITLEEALESFKLPRNLGDWKGKDVTVSIGRFGPYVKWWSTFASIKHPDDPYEIQYEQAVDLVEAKIQKDIENTLMEFEYKDKPWKVMKWRRSPVIKWNRKTIKLSKTVDVENMSEEDVIKIVEAEVGTKKKASKKSTKKKTTKKKTTTRKKKTSKKVSKS